MTKRVASKHIKRRRKPVLRRPHLDAARAKGVCRPESKCWCLTARKPKPKQPSHLEAEFRRLMRVARKAHPSLPEPTYEYVFAPGRKYRADAAWVFPARPGGVAGVLVELEGGIFMGRYGSHSSGVGILRDIEKQNLAVRLGFKPLRYTAVCLRKRPFSVIDEIVEVVLG